MIIGYFSQVENSSQLDYVWLARSFHPQKCNPAWTCNDLETGLDCKTAETSYFRKKARGYQ